MVVVVAVLHLLRVDIDRLLGRGERCLGTLRVGPRGHRGGRGGQSRVHLLLRRLVGQVEGLGCCCSYNTQEHNTVTNNTTEPLVKLYSCKNDGKPQLSTRVCSPAAACWCCWCWTGLAAGCVGGPPCCGGPPCWAWPVGVAEGWGCCGWGCKVALGWGYC